MRRSCEPRSHGDRRIRSGASPVPDTLRFLATLPIRLYQLVVSPMFPASCIYTPSCSWYAREAIQRHGVLWGTLLAVARMVRCSALFSGGPDPVPERASWAQVRSDYRTFRARRRRS